MLKLLKYEWKACARICLPLYAAMLLMSVFSALMTTDAAQDFMNGIPTAILVMLYFAMLVAVFVVTAVILIQRFYKNLLGDEGYLMFTLPVTVAQHIWSKVIVAIAICFLSGIVALLSIGVLGSGTGLFADIAMLLQQFGHVIATEPNTLGYMLEGILLLVLSTASGVLYLYLCMALGHLAKKHRVLMSVVWYFVLSTVAQFLLSFVLLGVATGPLQSLAEALQNLLQGVPQQTMLHGILLGFCFATAIPGAICYGGTYYVLKNRLNLE